MIRKGCAGPADLRIASCAVACPQVVKVGDVVKCFVKQLKPGPYTSSQMLETPRARLPCLRQARSSGADDAGIRSFAK